MAIITVYHEEDGKTYTVTAVMGSNVLDRVNGNPSDGDIDYFIKISTTMKRVNGSSYGEYVVRTLEDVPDGYSVATSFKELISYYVDYFITGAELGQSSSLSSESQSSLSSLSSSSRSSNSSSSKSSSSMSSNSSSSQSSSSSSSI